MMACLCASGECPYVAEGIKMSCIVCPYSDGEESE